MDKTAAGTGTFQFRIYRGTNGTTADTADVTQSFGTQTAAIDNMTVDVELVVTTTGATGAYYWSIIPTHTAARITGFGLDQAAATYFAGTVSSVALNTASLKFGLSFIATTGTPTITVPLVRANGYV
jgi:autotransporter adhesin